MERHIPSILIVTRDDALSRTAREAFPADGRNRLQAEQASFAQMNGSAAELVFRHDIVLFDTDPDDRDEVEALGHLLESRRGSTAFLAFTGDDVSIAKARRLREIGIDEVLPITTPASELPAVVDAILKIRRAPAPAEQRGGPESQVIAVARARGGLGATTYAVNLATRMAQRTGLLKRKQGARVALIDLDLQFGNAGVLLDIEDNGGLLQLIAGDMRPDATYMKSILQHHTSGLDVLTAPAQLVPLTAAHGDQVGAMIDALRPDYDVVIVDLPLALVDWLSAVFARTTSMHLVTDLTVPCVRQAKRLIDLVHEDHIGLPVEIVVNRQKKPLVRSELQREAEQALGTKIAWWLPDNAPVARKAADLGRPIVEAAASSDLGKAFEKIASETLRTSHPQLHQRTL